MWATGVSGALGVICLLVAIPLWVFNHAERNKLWFQLLIICLILTGMAGIMSTQFVGGHVRQFMGWGERGLASLASSLGLVVPSVLGMIGILLLIKVVANVRNKDVDEGTLVATAGLSLSAGAIPGAVGALAVTVLGIPVHLIAGLVALGFGI